MAEKIGQIDKSEVVDGKYTVKFFIKKGSHAETYRVKDEHDETLFLKLFDLPKLHRTQFDGEGNIKEIEFLKRLNHENVVNYRDDGRWTHKGNEYAYLVLDFISGETLEERLNRKQTIDWYNVEKYIKGVLKGLSYLHEQETALIHNDINHQNVMLELTNDDPTPILIDFGYARALRQSTKVYYRQGLNPYYLAPECFDNEFSPRTDIFSVGALMYHLLFGVPPWKVDISSYRKDRVELEQMILQSRRKPLKRPAIQNHFESDMEEAMPVIEKALQENPDNRFLSAEEMLDSISNKRRTTPEYTVEKKDHTGVQHTQPKSAIESDKIGFSQIAGMDALKETLYHDFIKALEEPDLYKEYGLTIPNGILLYGPPGCGKSFFAEKLTEEVGFNFRTVKPSNLASIYVHGSQEKIGQLFDKARENAPTILNFEEFDALVPKRSKAGTESHQSGEVNEFLAQLNNCGKDGVFVIATTNQPQLIDTAVLRTGRIDKIFYVPPPDYKARKEMFKMYLNDRPITADIDYDELAEKTENYVAIDIKHLCDEGAREALKRSSKISHEIMMKTIDNSRMSVNIEELEHYNKMRNKLEATQRKGYSPRRQIGFNK